MPLLPWQPQLSLMGLMAIPSPQFLMGCSCRPWGWDECQVELGGRTGPRWGSMAGAGGTSPRWG